ncbi:hypothetical protein Tco_1293297 [Tanacetum coccineum]
MAGDLGSRPQNANSGKDKAVINGCSKITYKMIDGFTKKAYIELHVDVATEVKKGRGCVRGLRAIENEFKASKIATDKDGANPQLSNSIAKDDPGKYAPNDSISKQQGIDKGTKNYSIDHIITGTNLNVLVDKIKSAKDELETAHIKIGTEEEAIFDKNEFNTSLELTSYEDAKEIKMEDLSKLVKDACIDLMGLDSPKDDTPFIVEDDEDEEVHIEEVYIEQHTETEDSSVPKLLSPKTIQIQELSTQLLLL